MPNVLIIHLKRFEFNFNTFQNEKVNTRFEFPPILDLNKYTFKKYNESINKKFEDERLNELMTKQDDDYIYRLVGVNIHRGAAQHGHYWSLININRGKREKEGAAWHKVEDDIWRAYDDDEVRFQSFKDLAAETFGGDATAMKQEEIDTFIGEGSAYGKSAYMLVYERKTKSPVREIKVKGEVTEADKWAKEQKRDKVAEALALVDKVSEIIGKVDNAGPPQPLDTRQVTPENQPRVTATTAASEPELDVEMAAPIASESETNQEKEKITAMVEWKDISDFIPEWINDLVRMDNTEFVIDR